MTGELQSLYRKTTVAPIPVNLPNGASVVADLQGSVDLSPKINLDKSSLCSKFFLQFALCGTID